MDREGLSMDDLISRQAAIDDIKTIYEYHDTVTEDRIIDHLKRLPSVDAIEVVRCKGCKHQEKYFYADKRLKDGGRYSYGCDLAEGYSHVCLDDDFCSRGEQKDG